MVSIEPFADELVEELKRLFPDFGKHLAIESKEIETPHKKTDKEADWGVKHYNQKTLDTP